MPGLACAPLPEKANQTRYTLLVKDCAPHALEKTRIGNGKPVTANRPVRRGRCAPRAQSLCRDEVQRHACDEVRSPRTGLMLHEPHAPRIESNALPAHGVYVVHGRAYQHVAACPPRAKGLFPQRGEEGFFRLGEDHRVDEVLAEHLPGGFGSGFHRRHVVTGGH